MLIVGGTYIEQTTEPSTEFVFGSGMRAAAAVSGAGAFRPRLVTCLDPTLRLIAQGVAAAFGIGLEATERHGPICFSYHTPVSQPRLRGADQPRIRLDAEDSASALVFGMIEADCHVTAPGIVYDPQGVEDARRIDRTRLTAERFAVVANTHEIVAAGRSQDIVEAARRTIAETRADLVVVKRGALGSLVVEAGGPVTPVGPYPTDTVWPIGSGDVFSAAFAWAWLEEGRPPADAAVMASAAAAFWCGTQTLPIPLSAGSTPTSLQVGVALSPEAQAVPVYLAGPFFTISERWLVSLTREALRSLGADVFSPLHDVGSARSGGAGIAERDLAGLQASKSVLGLLDGSDPGTLYEVGYAAARGIPVVGFAEEPHRDDYLMVRGTAALATSDIATAVYQSIWAGMRAL